MEHSEAHRASTRRHVALAFVVGLGLRLAVGQLLTPEPSWDGVIYERAASQLAAGDGYTLRMLNPAWPWPDLPTAFYPPGWPALLSLWKLLHAPLRFDLVICALLGALAIPLAAALGGALGGRAAKRTTAWLVALWPGGCLLAGSWMGEPLFTAILLAALIPLLGPAGARPSRLAVSALLFGLAAYIRPGALALAPLVLVARVGPGERRLRRTLVAGSLAALALLPVLPWMARNLDHLGGPVVSSSAGANLLVGTFASRFTRIPGALDCPAGPREIARDRCRRELALARIGADPLGWMALGLGKLAHTFGYEATPAVQLGAGLGWRDPAARWEVWLLVAPCTLFFWGLLWFAARSRTRARGRVVWAAIVAVALLHGCFLGGDRYHLPLVPLIAALAAAGARCSTTRRSRRGAPRYRDAGRNAASSPPTARGKGPGGGCSTARDRRRPPPQPSPASRGGSSTASTACLADLGCGREPALRLSPGEAGGSSKEPPKAAGGNTPEGVSLGSRPSIDGANDLPISAGRNTYRGAERSMPPEIGGASPSSPQRTRAASR